MKHHEKQVGNTTSWLTPISLIEAIGEFDFDPCGWFGHPTASHVLHLPEDGLEAKWRGSVWLNPPYGRGIDQWLIRLAEHNCGVALVPSRTETVWFQQAAARCSAALFLEKRVAFLDPKTMEPVDNNTVGSVLLSYGVYSRERLRNCGLPGWKVIR